MSCLATAFMAVICLVTRDTTTKPLLFHPKGERFRAAQNGAAPPSVGRRARMRAGPTALFRFKTMKDTLHEIVERFRPFVTNVRELLRLVHPAYNSGRPRKVKPPDLTPLLPGFTP